MKDKKILKNEKGFTLIEIIAVIIIMGILAAVAVPKFFSMQEDAKKAAISSAFAEASARFNNAFAKYLLDNQKAPLDVASLATVDYLGSEANCAITTTGEDIGDFNVCWSKEADGSLKITVMAADTISDFATTTLTKTKTIGAINWGS